MAWNIPAAIVNATDRTAAWFNAIRDSLEALKLHDHSGIDGDGAGLDAYGGNGLHGGVYSFPPWFPNAGGQFTAYQAGTTPLGGLASSGAQNDAGTWTFWLPGKSTSYSMFVLFVGATDKGIAAVNLNGVASGTIEMYRASTQIALAEGKAFTHAADGVCTVTLTMSAKNASSSAYGAFIRLFSFF